MQSIENRCLEKEAFQTNSKPLVSFASDEKMLLLRSEMFPDRYSHITTTVLEYPEKKTEIKAEKEKKRRPRSRNNVRYMTQPVTLIEIKEIEEEQAQNFSNDIISTNIKSLPFERRNISGENNASKNGE